MRANAVIRILAMGAIGFGLFAAAPAEAQSKKTERQWKAKCASCHGMDGKADTKKGKEMAVEDMTTAAFQSRLSDAEIEKVILEGLDEVRDGQKKEMDGYKDELKPAEVKNLVEYIRSLAAAK